MSFYCSGISDEEKAVVRTALLQCIEEPVPQVFQQLSLYLWLAKVCISQFIRDCLSSGSLTAGHAYFNHAYFKLCIPYPTLFRHFILYILQVSTQLSVLIARIARLDCPGHWPELLPVLTEVLC